MVDKAFKEFLIDLQEKMKKLIVFSRMDVKKIKNILAVDMAYKGNKSNKSVAVSVVCDLKNDQIVEKAIVVGKVEFPYIPGLLFFREAPLMLKSIKKIKSSYDIILVDAHGYAHPRRMGLATVIGILTNKPTIGIAKSLLVGKVNKINEKLGKIIDGDEIIGYEIIGDRKFYVSPGSNIDFKSVSDFVEMMKFKYPKILRIADKLTKEYKNKL